MPETGPDKRTVEAHAARVPLDRAEALRQEAAARGILRDDLKVDRTPRHVVLPLVRPLPADLAGPGVEATRQRFEPAHRPPRSFRDVVDVPPEIDEHLPSSWDVIGDVAVVKLNAEAWTHRGEIGRAMLQAHPALRTVAADRGVQGAFRVRDLEIVAGSPSLHTVHRENGLDFEVDLSSAYFSPRLATERMRVARLVEGTERIADLFAGVGPFALTVARTAPQARVQAIELNPDAYEYLEKNVQHNRLQERVTPQPGDARQVAPRLAQQDGPFDRIVMNLPHEAAAFLDVAAPAVRPQGWIHIYAMVDRNTVAQHGRHLAERADAAAGRWEVAATRTVRNYSPQQIGAAFDLKRII